MSPVSGCSRTTALGLDGAEPNLDCNPEAQLGWKYVAAPALSFYLSYKSE